MKDKQIRWKSDEYRSVEECSCRVKPSAVEISGNVRGLSANAPFHLVYSIFLDKKWQTKRFSIEATVAGKHVLWNGVRKVGGWMINGHPGPDPDGCIDIDISLTPLTNTLPIRRAFRGKRREAIVKVIYLDILNQEVTAKLQQYKKLAPGLFNYQNIPNDFEADITVDADGFVVSYPGLFERI